MPTQGGEGGGGLCDYVIKNDYVQLLRRKHPSPIGDCGDVIAPAPYPGRFQEIFSYRFAARYSCKSPDPKRHHRLRPRPRDRAQGRTARRDGGKIAHFPTVRDFADELGYLPFETNAAHLFCQLVSRRCERGSVLITSNRSVGEWGSVFGDPVVATAILDRLLHYSQVITVRGDSYRLREKRRSDLIKASLGDTPAIA
jgi:hypothetical protein